MRWIAAFILLWSVALRAEAPAGKTPAPVCEQSDAAERNAYELGLLIQFLLPNQLPDFQTTLQAYGPYFAFPVGPNTVQIQGLYGSSNLLTLYNAEAGYRINVPTPFFNGYVLGGVHFLHYTYQQRSHDAIGANVGLGLFFAMGKDFKGTLGMKIYVTERAVMSFGGGFSFLL